ncbi:HAD family hydrolase [Providencia rettgeri]
MNMSKPFSNKKYIFDICDTLYDSNTTFDFCKWRNKKISWRFILWLSSTTIGKILNKLSIKLFNKEFSRFLHLKSLKNINRIELYKEANLFVSDFLADKKICHIHKILIQAKQENKIIYLVSASIDPIVHAIAKNLGVKYISSELNYSKNICQGFLHKDLLGNKHLIIINDISLVVTDNISDYSLCKMAEHSLIIVNSKNKSFWVNHKLPGMTFYEQ